MGFAFSPKEAYKTGEDRMEELREFNTRHGHLNISTNNPEVGEFIGRQRHQYKMLFDGMESLMTDDMIAIPEKFWALSGAPKTGKIQAL